MSIEIKDVPQYADDPLTTLDQIIDYLDWAQAQINNNVEIDLEGLDYSIENTCAAIKESGPDIRDEAAPKMQEMVDKLEELGDALRNHPMVTDQMSEDD